MEVQSNIKSTLPIAAIIVASLGYFVDIYDLLLFSIVRVPSLRSLGLSPQEVTSSGIFLLNIQMTGLMLGGLFWGILGDKKGRLTVLFGTICLYSLANIANGFVHSVESYAFWRFIAGFGLAGELGAGITLVAELMPKEKRGYATSMVAGVGISGAIVAFYTANFFDWRTSFFVGGGLGLILLVLRIGVSESFMYHIARKENVVRGNFFQLFKNRKTFLKYLRCIVIGLPIWLIAGILITLSPEFGKALGVQGTVNAGVAVACCYGASMLSDLFSALLSQYLKSRIKVVCIYLVIAIISISTFFILRDLSLPAFYGVCLFLGFTAGYWAMFITIAAEQFGTNIRATVTTTATNFVRGALVPISLLLQYLRGIFNGSIITAGIIVSVLVLAVAFLALSQMEETFSKDLDYSEE
ncbi:MFS transporter [Pedobacter sp. MC2016-15]|uniref:MFS transporter n=1 Tax=Pedobacter sp. MC2016-15 TaxID=2994473 RepID=UPI00224848A5|nr:MFS transporter [Pedobacter sp. MC2016-15]MCX2479000.1 MFS transporter [Pedobacter sp. MC2016-15]